jgi:HEAT repeats
MSLEDVFIAEHGLRIQALANLDATEVQTLKQIALGEVPERSQGNRVKALSALTRLRDVDPKTLGRIIANNEETAELRAAAAINLSFLPTEAAERELIANLTVTDDVVRQKAIKSLGRIGSEAALTALDRNTDEETSFAKALISYRLGSDRFTLPFVAGVDRQGQTWDNANAIAITQMNSVELADALELMEDSFFGIEISKKLGYKMACGKRTVLLLLNQQWTNGDLLSNLFHRKLLAGLLIQLSEETGTYSVQSLLLTSPTGTSTLNITICRTDGEFIYSGQGNLIDGRMSFSVTDVERVGHVPLQITGYLTDKQLAFQSSYSLRKRQNKRTPGMLIR